MRSWSDRSREERTLLNPAIVAAIVAEASRNHQDAVGHGLPFSLTFLAVPMAMQDPVRERLPKSIATSLTVWGEANADIRAGLPDRIRRFADVTREGVIVGSQFGAFSFEGSRIVPSQRRRRWTASGEAAELVRAGAFLGRWFARSGPSSDVFSILGLRP